MTECDEGLVYAEGSLVPYHVRNREGYRLDYILAEIDMEKAMIPKDLLGKRSVFARMGSGLSKLVPYFGLIVAGIVIIWAVLTG